MRSDPATRLYRLAQIFALAVMGGICAAYSRAAFHAWPGEMMAGGAVALPDFFAYLTAGMTMLAHGPAALYDLEVQRAVQSALTQDILGVRTELFLAYINPPPLAWALTAMMAPLRVFDDPFAAMFACWCLLHFACALAATRLVARHYGLGALSAFVTAALFLGSPFYGFSLLQGQVSGVLLLCGAGIVTSLARNDYPRAGGWWLVALAIKPQLYLYLALPVFFDAPRAIRHAVLGGGLLIIAACLLIHGLQFPLAYLRLLETLSQSQGSELGGYAQSMANLRGALARLLPEAGALPLSRIAAAAWVGTGLAAICIWQRVRHMTPDRQMASLCLLFQLGIFLSPWLHRHDLAAAAVTTVLTLIHLRDLRLRTVWLLGLVALYLANGYLPEADWPRFLYQFWVMLGTAAWLRQRD